MTPIPLPDDAELAAEISAVEGLPLSDARTIAQNHLGKLTRAAGRATIPAAPAPQEPTLFQTLRTAQRHIAELRAQGLHSSAATLRDNALCKVEAYLDPEAALIRQEQLAAQRELVRATLAERVEIDGVPVPF